MSHHTDHFAAVVDVLQHDGCEFADTAGHARRCGWQDQLITRYTQRINGVTDFVLTKLDILGGFDKIPVAVAYDVNGTRYDELPDSQTAFHHAKPIYEYFDGWTEDISDVRNFEDLPTAAQDYVLAIEELAGARISAVGVGPSREQLIVRHDIMA